MPRRARQAPGGTIYHVLNRAAGRRQLFATDEDYSAFLRVFAEALERPRGANSAGPVRVMSYCLMPNHWHLVLWPLGDDDLSELLFWLTMTHTQRWRHFRRTVGEGPLYQGRFKCFPVQVEGLDGGSHFRTVCRYVERNPLRAGMVGRAQDWRYSSLHARSNPAAAAGTAIRLHPWPVEEPPDWLAWVNEAQTAKELDALRTSVRRSSPFGDDAWRLRTAAELGLNHTLRPPGRPKKLRPGAPSPAARRSADTAQSIETAPVPVSVQGNNTGTPPQKGNGNVIDDGVRTYAYDALNRMLTAARKSDGLTVGQYAYDALGRRIQKTVTNGGVTNSVPNGTTRFLYEGQREVEEVASSATTAQYAWGQYIDELVQIKTYASSGPQPLAAGSYYLLSDLLYRSAALTNSSGAVVEAYDNDAYGNTLLFKGPGTDSTWFTNDDAQAAYPACRYVFTGREYDAETGIYQYRSRYYNPQLARFQSRDLFGYMQGPLLYQYVFSNPVRFLDPNGAEATDENPLPLWIAIASNSPPSKGPADQAIAAERQKHLKQMLAALQNLLEICKKKGYIEDTIGVNYYRPDCDVESPKDRWNIHPRTGTDDSSLLKSNIKKVRDLVEKLFKNPSFAKTVPIVIYSPGLLLDAGDKSALGVTLGPYGNIVITGQDADILAHELGHYAGYDCGDMDRGTHSSDKTNIMYPTVQRGEDNNKIEPDRCWCVKILQVAKDQLFADKEAKYMPPK